MFCFFNWLKKLFSKKPYTKKQKEIFKQIQISDIIYAKLPLSKEEEKKIEQSHLHRPFLVVNKGKEDVTCFVLSSVKRKRLYSYDFYKQAYLFADHTKPSFIYLNDIKQIPIQNIHHIIKHMDKKTLMRLDKRLYIAGTFNKSRPRFNVKLYPEKADIIKHDDKLYLVVNYLNHNLILNQVYDKYPDKNGYYILKNRNHTYFVNYKQDLCLPSDYGYQYIDIIPLEEVKKMRLQANKLKENTNNYYFRYPIGTTFTICMNEYLYLYHKGKRCYGIYFDEESFDPQITHITDLKYMQKKGQLELFEVQYIMEYIVKNNNDVHNVINQILIKLRNEA